MIPPIAKTWPVFSATSTIGMNQKRLKARTGSLKSGKVSFG